MKDEDHDGERGYQGFSSLGLPEYLPDWVGGAPSSGRDQSCAICGSSPVAWVHPLDSTLVRYRAHGKGHTLPTFWALCERCEGLYQAGEDEAAVELMKVHEAGTGRLSRTSRRRSGS